LLPSGTTSADWYTGSLTVTVPNDGTANGLRCYFNLVSSESANYWEIAQVQLNEGAIALPFEQESYAETLAKCQRYLHVLGGDQIYETFGHGHANDTTVYTAAISLPVRMRIPPTISISAASHFMANSTSLASATFTTSSNGNSSNNAVINISQSGLFTSQSYYQLRAQGAADARIYLSAEL